ncbi:MAG: DUF4266 domain-containing protein [Cytophagales bacterium]|nr:DUF4266 domain-containing protein [Cytophagales bacterium]
MKKLLFCLAFLFCSSCVAVKEYEKVNLNDPDMELADRKIEQTICKFHSYREASSGATSGSTGGGCGCN